MFSKWMPKFDLARMWPWLLLSLVIIVLDQATKYWISSTFFLGEVRSVLPIFDLVLAHNYGMAFSFLSDASGWQRWFLSTVSFVASFFIAGYWLPEQRSLLGRLSMALILGGALGNFIDRAFVGYVVDFIAVHYQHRYFPAFNVADSAICVGAALLMVETFFFTPDEPSSKADK